MVEPVDTFEDEFAQAFGAEALEGARIKLVGLKESDVDAAWALVDASREHLSRYLPWVKTTSVADVRKKIRNWILAEQLSQGACWCIMAGDADAHEELVGFIMMEARLSNRSATISYWLGEKFCGHGYMTDSLQTLARFCFETLNLNRLELFSSVENPKSAAVALRAGFKQEGVCRDYEMVGDFFVDHRHFSLLKRD